MFVGEFHHTIDDKSRLSIPARFRAQLDEGVFITRGVEKCLYVWTRTRWNEMAEKLGTLSWMRGDARRFNRLFFSGTSESRLDKLGRVIVPQFLKDYAGLGDEVVIVGNNDRIEVWSREGWQVERSAAEDKSGDLAEHLADLGF